MTLTAPRSRRWTGPKPIRCGVGMIKFLALGAAGVAAAFLLQPSDVEARSSGGFSYGTGSRGSSHYVRPHTNRSGNYVGGHYRTNRDSSRSNNYGAYGNYNRHTGGIGDGYGRSR